MEGSKGEENTGEDGTDEYDSVSEEDIRSQDEPVNEPVERDMNQEDEMYPDDYDESYDDHYDDNYDDAYNEPYDDDYDDTYDDVYDNPNPSKKSEEYDIEIDSQNKFTIDFPVRHSHPLEINVFLLHFTYNQKEYVNDVLKAPIHFQGLKGSIELRDYLELPLQYNASYLTTPRNTTTPGVSLLLSIHPRVLTWQSPIVWD